MPHIRGMAVSFRSLSLFLTLVLVAPSFAFAASNLDVGSRLKGAPSTVSPPPNELLPQPFRPNCRWQTVRVSDPNLGWVTRRVMVCQ